MTQVSTIENDMTLIPILVEWEDASTMHDEISRTDILPLKEDLTSSVGFLLYEDADYLVIAANCVPVTDNYKDVLIIPHSLVRSMRYLETQ